MEDKNKQVPLRQLDGCINTASGKKFDLFNPTVDMIDLTDIAKGLAYKPHFGGQTPKFFSVAEHSIITRDLMLLDPKIKSTPELELAALLHDAAEAYVGDMIKPLKVHMPDFCAVEDYILKVIFKSFRLDIQLMKQVKEFDRVSQDIEYRFFYQQIWDPFIAFHTPDEAYELFVGELRRLLVAKNL